MPLYPTPARLLLLKWLPPEAYRVGAFMLNTILLFLAAIYMLRGKGIQWIPSMTGAMALCFCGQTFSIIAAGHLGKFGMMPFVFSCWGCSTVPLRGSPPFTTCCAARWPRAVCSQQMDVAFLFLILGAAYGDHSSWSEADTTSRPGTIGRGSPVALGIAAAAFAIAGLPVVMSTSPLLCPCEPPRAEKRLEINGVCDQLEHAA